MDSLSTFSTASLELHFNVYEVFSLEESDGPSGTQSHPYTRGYQKTLEQFPNLAVHFCRRGRVASSTAAMSGVPTSMSRLYFILSGAPDLFLFRSQRPSTRSLWTICRPIQAKSALHTRHPINGERRAGSRRRAVVIRLSPTTEATEQQTEQWSPIHGRMSFPSLMSRSSSRRPAALKLYQGAQVATSGTQLPANRTSKPPSATYSQRHGDQFRTRRPRTRRFRTHRSETHTLL